MSDRVIINLRFVERDGKQVLQAQYGTLEENIFCDESTGYYIKQCGWEQWEDVEQPVVSAMNTARNPRKEIAMSHNDLTPQAPLNYYDAGDDTVILTMSENDDVNPLMRVADNTARGYINSASLCARLGVTPVNISTGYCATFLADDGNFYSIADVLHAMLDRLDTAENVMRLVLKHSKGNGHD